MLMAWVVLPFPCWVPLLQAQFQEMFGPGHKGGPWWCVIYQPCKQGIEGTRQRQGRHSGREAICRCKASNIDGRRRWPLAHVQTLSRCCSQSQLWNFLNLLLFPGWIYIHVHSTVARPFFLFFQFRSSTSTWRNMWKIGTAIVSNLRELPRSFSFLLFFGNLWELATNFNGDF